MPGSGASWPGGGVDAAAGGVRIWSMIARAARCSSSACLLVAVGAVGVAEADSGDCCFEGAPTSFHRSAALENRRSASRESPRASRTCARACTADAVNALLWKRRATAASSSAAACAASMLPSAMAISTCTASRGARCSSLAGGQLLGRHPRRSLERVVDRGRRCCNVAPSKMHLGESWLSVPSGLMGGKECFVGASDVSRTQPDAAELADRPSQLPA